MSNAGTETVTGTFYSMETPKSGADTYLEIDFTKEAGYIGIGVDIFIHSRIHKEDFSRYDLTDDFSLQPEERYMDWEKVDVFVGTKKVWGIGVLPAEGEEESGRIDYANTAYQPVRAEMFNYQKKESSNSIAPRFRVYNTGTKDFRLSDLRINYFYTTDDDQEQVFEADHVGIGGNYNTFISSKDVTSEFSEVGEGNLETYCIADIGFTRDDVTVAPGEYVELNVRIHRQDWSNYAQSNDYSFCEEYDTYQEWDKISVFLDDVWVYGSMPLSYAGLIDPEPEKEKAKVESKISPTVITDKAGNSSSYSYSVEGYLTKVVRPDGSSVSLEYDSRGNRTVITDDSGSVTKFSYDSSNRIRSQTDANGNVIKYSYTPDAKIAKTVDKIGNIMEIEYNKDGEIKKETDEKGYSTLYRYSTKTGMLSDITDALGGRISYTYDRSGQLISEKDKVGGVTTYEYDTFEHIIRETKQILYIIARTKQFKAQMPWVLL